jgi:hypothetical protein
MVFKVHASTAKLRVWLHSALEGFDKLDEKTAVAQAKLKLRCALDYLDSVDRAESILSAGFSPVGANRGNGQAGVSKGAETLK